MCSVLPYQTNCSTLPYSLPQLSTTRMRCRNRCCYCCPTGLTGLTGLTGNFGYTRKTKLVGPRGYPDNEAATAAIDRVNGVDFRLERTPVIATNSNMLIPFSGLVSINAGTNMARASLGFGQHVLAQNINSPSSAIIMAGTEANNGIFSRLPHEGYISSLTFQVLFERDLINDDSPKALTLTGTIYTSSSENNTATYQIPISTDPLTFIATDMSAYITLNMEANSGVKAGQSFSNARANRIPISAGDLVVIGFTFSQTQGILATDQILNIGGSFIYSFKS